MKRFLLVMSLFVLGFCIPLRAQVINAASCAESDVHTAFAAVTSSTTTINIPACTSGVSWTGNETLTVINSNFTLAGAGSQTTSGGGDKTVIEDSAANANPLITVQVPNNGTFRWAGITVEEGTGQTGGNIKYNGVVSINGQTNNIRVDHSHFNTSSSGASMLQFQGAAGGVTDHNIFDGTEGGTSNAVRAYNWGTYNNDALGVGDQSWAAPTNFGSANFMFIEDNVFNGGAADDCTKGGRFVMRHNTFNAYAPAPVIQTHPTGGGERERGCRAQEDYLNTFNIQASNYVNSCIWLSSGTAMIWGNTTTSSSAGGGTGCRNFIEILAMRQDNSTYPQSPTPAGWGYAGSSSGLSGDESPWDGNPTSASGYPDLDQPGRGQGQLLVNDFSNVLNNSTGTIAWPNQALEPVYEWEDVYSPVPSNPSVFFSNQGVPGTFTANVDYYLWASTSASNQSGNSAAFNGTVGVGDGPLASRPTSCTKGVAYWATDQGNWNQSGSGGQGQLYTCTATGAPGTWALSYTPYTYPHPLVSAATLPTASTPTFSPTGGTYPATQNVTISAATGTLICWNTTGASIVINGASSCPVGSTAFTSAISVTATETLHVVVGGPNFNDSAATTATYTIDNVQTVTFADTTIVNATPARQGINIGSIDYYDNGQHLKNLFGYNNPSLEPILDQQSILVTAAGTTTTFTDPNQFDPVQPNYWTGATYTVVQSAAGGAEAGCTGTITSNTGPNFPSGGSTAPIYTMGTACAHALQSGDLVFVSLTPTSTPESWWESGAGGVGNSSVSGGGQLISDTTDLCTTCGTQALEMNMPSSSASASFQQLWDTEGSDIFYLMNGTYNLSFWAKTSSGAPTLTVTCSRGSTGGFSTTVVPGPYTPSLTTTWAQYQFTFTAAETQASTSIGNAACFFRGSAVSAGALYIDNLSLVKTGTSVSNPTVFRDEDYALLQRFFGNGAATSANPGTLRYWVNQNGETAANLTALPYQRRPSSSGIFYQVGPAGGASMTLSLEDYLILCQSLGVQPYFEIPVTISTTDAANIVEFLAASTSTTYGARRQAAGIAAGLSSSQAAATWTSVFSKIYLSFCNECWNQSAGASLQNIPQRSGEPNGEVYYDYSTRAAAVLAAMRADSNYNASVMQLGINAQTGISFSMDAGIARSKPDYIEIENYLYGNVGSFSTDALLWQGNFVEPYDMMVDTSDPSNFYQSVHDYSALHTCGPSGTSLCTVNIYEWGQGSQNGTLDQTHMDFINAGGGQAAISAFQPLLHQQMYPSQIPQQNFFALSEFENGSAISGVTSKLWGSMVDAGGATNNVRPEFLGLALANQSIIGPMYSCPVSGAGSTFNFAGISSNGTAVPPGVPAVSNVPLVYAFCFKNGNSRSVVLVNTDLSNTHIINFAGTNPPTGSVTVRQVAPPSLDSMNEAATGSTTNHTAATVVSTTNTVASPSSITLPPYSATAIDYTVGGVVQQITVYGGNGSISGSTSTH